MEWECHECGHQHATLPEACERCGTRPEIVLNVWRCAHCGAEGIPSTSGRCPSCGAERARGVETAVAAEQRIEGEVARKLAAGEWLYCAYCETQVPPVDAEGKPHEVCPACQGPLSEATVQAAEEEIAASEASTYCKEKESARGSAAAPAAPAATPLKPQPRRRRRRIVAVVALAALGGMLYLGLRGPEPYQVAGRQWSRRVAIERFGPVQKEAWLAELPAAAYARSCSRQIHHHDRVPDGIESYTAQVSDGRRCTSYSYRKRGGTSVKSCSHWETRYRRERRTRTRYRQVPIYRERCRYTIDKWHEARRLTASGGDSAPYWPRTDGLLRGERAGQRAGSYVLLLKHEKESKPYTCTSQEEWQRYAMGANVLATTSLTGKITSIAPAK